MKLEHVYGYTPILSLANLSNLTFAREWCMRQICKVLKENYVHRYDTTIKKEVSKNSAKLPWPDSRVFTSRNRGPSPTSFVLVAHFPWFFSILPSSASSSNGVSCDQCTVPWIGANFSPTWHWAPFFLARPCGHQTWQLWNLSEFQCWNAWKNGSSQPSLIAGGGHCHWYPKQILSRWMSLVPDSYVTAFAR